MYVWRGKTNFRITYLVMDLFFVESIDNGNQVLHARFSSASRVNGVCLLYVCLFAQFESANANKFEIRLSCEDEMPRPHTHAHKIHFSFRDCFEKNQCQTHLFISFPIDRDDFLTFV